MQSKIDELTKDLEQSKADKESSDKNTTEVSIHGATCTCRCT